MKKNELARRALNHPELFSSAELVYFQKWLEMRRIRKEQEKQKKAQSESTYLQ